ncbi:hypothetical protein [Brevundimonas sp.]|uniref:glycosyltransferase family protein n=1 Tax=Brevundimonas sp. TaxID=1871086 RepID=UPI0025C0D718|nr:hypothetical protein [Brevundimonas sp.]
MGAKTCLLIMPLPFYAFERVICDELKARGYEVTLANEEYPHTPLGRVMGKLDLPIIRWWTRRVFRRRFLNGGRWTLVIIIKGRGVGPELVKDLKASADRVVGYHFDALSYDRATRRWGASVDRVSTFDYRDARDTGWPVVELFSAQPPLEPAPPVRHRLSAIQRNHSGRLAYLDRVVSALGSEETFVFIFEKGPLSLLLNAIRQPALYWKWRKSISFKPLPYDQYLDALASSEFTLDYAHPLQTGATMRCFEARAMGVKIITNNPHTLESPYFSEQNAIVYPMNGDPDALRARVRELAGVRPAPSQRTPAQFVTELVGDDLSRSPEPNAG